MSCSSFEWTCARCGKTYTHPFSVSHIREFWKDNKKRVGEVCKECCAKVDDDNVRRRAKTLAGVE
nr:MAG TPA: MqsA [Caudoviricetes sp.]